MAEPLILGDPTGQPKVQVVPNIAMSGAKRGEKTWVQGSEVDAMIAAGWFSLIQTVAA